MTSWRRLTSCHFHSCTISRLVRFAPPSHLLSIFPPVSNIVFTLMPRNNELISQTYSPSPVPHVHICSPVSCYISVHKRHINEVPYHFSLLIPFIYPANEYLSRNLLSHPVYIHAESSSLHSIYEVFSVSRIASYLSSCELNTNTE